MKKIILFLLIGIMMTVGVNAVGSKSEDSWYTCDNSTRVTDSNNMYLDDNGTTPVPLFVDGSGGINGKLDLVTGKIAKACRIAEIANAEPLINTTNIILLQPTIISFSSWFNSSLLVEDLLIGIQNRTGVDPTEFLRITMNNSGVIANISNQIASTSPINTLEWYHIAVSVKNNQQITIWLDGISSTSLGNIGILPQILAKRTLARDINNANTFAGMIDDIRIWYDYELIQSDVNFLHNNGIGRPISLNESWTNSTPTINITLPINNTRQHNNTIFINWSIADNEDDNITFDVFLNATSLNLLTKLINYSGDIRKQGNFTLSSIINEEILGSINGTYFLRINGTDNSTNKFSILHSFNLTNNIDTITNVTINKSSISIGEDLRGYFNLTGIFANGVTDNDNCSISQTKWYINKTENLNAKNNSILLSIGNITLNSNITFSARCNDGYGETGWTNWVNSTTLSVGDTIIPQILSSNWSLVSITDGTQINISINVTDNNLIQEINITSANPNGLLINRTCQNINSNNYICNITFFDGDETSVIGIWNLTRATAMDTSNNLIIIYPNTTMEVTSAGGGGNGDSGGGVSGGGGGASIGEQITILGNLSLILKPPLINSNVFTFSPKTNLQKFKLELVPNKEIAKCISTRFSCSVVNNIITISYNISNSSRFITKIEDKITLIDKASLAKTIDAKVRFINFAWAIPYDSDAVSTKYLIFQLSEGNKGQIKGIRLWFIFTALISISILNYFAYKYGL